MFFEPKPPLTREAEKSGPNCQHWQPFTQYVYGTPHGRHQPRYGPPTPAIFTGVSEIAREVAAFVSREDIIILGISPALPNPHGGHTITVLYQELRDPNGGIPDEEESER